jgi:hypothetical protein
MTGTLAGLCLVLGARCVYAEIGEIQVDASPEKQAPAAPTDGSALWIKSGTRATLLVVDSHQKRAGVDPKTHKTLQEIPNSTSEADFIENQYTGDPYAEVNQRITIQPAAAGIYYLRLTGLQAGPYEIVVSGQGSNGSSVPGKNLEGLISEGQVKVLQLRFNPGAQNIISFVEETPH